MLSSSFLLFRVINVSCNFRDYLDKWGGAVLNKFASLLFLTKISTLSIDSMVFNLWIIFLSRTC